MFKYRLLIVVASLWASCHSPASAGVEFVWCGSVTPTSAKVTLKSSSDSDNSAVRIAFSQSADMSGAAFSSYGTASTSLNNRVVSLSLSGLSPNTRYYYTPEIAGALEFGAQGRFRTFPVGNASFMFAFASCSWTGSTHQVFTEIASRDPLFFMHMGDMHYENIGVNDPAVFRAALERVLSSPSQRALHRSTAFDYVWDDHDYGPNNSDSTAPGREAARNVYRQYFPHYPLVEGDDTAAAIYHTFDIGRVRFVVCDSRSARSPAGAIDDANKTMLGATQKAWFKEQLLLARDQGKFVVWVNSLPWIGDSGDDGWHKYTSERRELANFIADNGIRNLCMISGDAHMLAIDDGTNSGYADGGGAGFPVMHAAPLHRSPSPKGGPYSHGIQLASAGQFGTMTVTDTGDLLTVLWQGWRMQDEVMRYQFSVPMADCPENYVCGDVDADGTVGSDDLASLVEYYFRGGSSPCPFNSGDVNCDGVINLLDLVYLSYYIGGRIPGLCCQNTEGKPWSHRLFYQGRKSK